MDKPTKSVETVESKKPNFFKSPAHLLVLLIILLVLIGIGLYLKQNNQSSTSILSPATYSNVPNLSMTSSDKSPALNSNVTVTVWADSNSINVNAVQAIINYPTDKLDFVGFDNADSPYEIQAQATNNNGQIKIAKGHKGNLSGRQLVTKINFRTKDTSGMASLTYQPDSHIVNVADTQDIMKQTTGLDLNIGANQ